MSGSTIVWECDVCNRPVADGEGYITVSYRDLSIFRQAMDAHDARMAEKKYPGSWFLIHDLPQRVEWKVLHRACDPAPDSDDYWMGIEQVRTHKDVIRKSAHLFGKKWIADTTWATIMRRAAQ